MHGYLSSKEAFTAQIAYFSKFFKVTAIDFLGFGHSRALTKPFSVDDYADWTKEVLLLLGVQKPHVVAHSFGCRVAVKLASKDGGFFDKIVLTGPAGVIVNRGFSYRAKVKTYRLIKRFAPSFAEKRFGSAEYRALPPVMKESYKKIVNEDLRVCAEKVENETLILEGACDTITTLAEAKIYQNRLKRATLKVMDGGHFAFVDNPLAFNLHVEEFLYV